MTTQDIKLLTVKMRGVRGSAKTEFLLALARLARGFGMVPALEADGHNMSITSTRAQRLAFYEFNHRQVDASIDWPAGGRRPLLPDGDVA